jgi:uncharacterized phiE125 gp8 family phage protein
VASLSLVTAPTGEVIDLATVKSHCRVDLSDEDALFIDQYIPEAEQHVEVVTNRQLRTATYEMTLDGWPCWIEVPKPPLRAVTFVKYVDTAGVTQTLATSQYQVVMPSISVGVVPTVRRGRIYPAYGVTWPTTRCQPDSVIVRFDAGYGAAADIPAKLRVALLIRTGCNYLRREPTDDEQRAITRHLTPFMSHPEQRQ